MKTIRYLFENDSLTVTGIITEAIATVMIALIWIGVCVLIMGAV